MNSIILVIKIPGIFEILLIFVGIIILFGGKKIPEMMKGLGKGITEFRNATKDSKNSETKNNEEDA